MEEKQSDKRFKDLYIPVGSILLFLLLAYVSFPYYRCFIDPDAVAYLTIAKHYAAGDYMRAVNGLWSPFHPWLVAICMKGGMDGLFAAQLTNGLACACILCCTWVLFRRFRTDRFITLAMMAALPVFLTYCLYKQLFDDLWQLVFLLCYLLLIMSEGFLTRWWKWLLCGLIGALAFYAKTYSFYFILIHLPVAVFVLSRKEKLVFRFYVVRVIGTYLITQLLLLGPWVWLMHKKYGGWSLSKAGAFNTHWLINDGHVFRSDIKQLVPPAYPDSPSFWEDPWLVIGPVRSVFSDPSLFLKQIARSVYAVFQGFHVINEISPLLLVVLLATAVAVFFVKGQQLFNDRHSILLWASLIMPLGYATQHFEARYIWLLAFTGIILGAAWLEGLRDRVMSKWVYYACVLVFAFSFISYPVFDMENMFRKGEDTWLEAQKLKALHIQGSFTSNDNQNRPPVIALLNGGSYYTIEHFDFDHRTLLAEMRRYRVKYYFHYHKPPDDGTTVFPDEYGRPLPEMTQGRMPGLSVFLVNP